MPSQPRVSHAMNPQLNRRTFVQSAAWSVPVIATAVAAPLASASGVQPPVPNTSADYYWSSESQGTFTKLTSDGWLGKGGYSIQVSFRGTAYPQNATMQITVVFDTPVTVTAPSDPHWTVDATGPGTSFVFTQTNLSEGGALTFLFQAVDQSATVTTNSTMNVLNPGSATWTNLVDSGSVDLTKQVA